MTPLTIDEAEKFMHIIGHMGQYFDQHNIFASSTIMVRAHLEYDNHFIGQVGQGHTTYVISNSSANTYVLGASEWKELEWDPYRTANLVAFDPTQMQKHSCPIITAATKVFTNHRTPIILIVRDTILNEGGTISLASKFQTHKFRLAIDSIPKYHQHPDSTPGTQAMYLQGDPSTKDVTIPFEVSGALAAYAHYTPSDQELETLPKYFLTAIGWSLGPAVLLQWSDTHTRATHYLPHHVYTQ